MKKKSAAILETQLIKRQIIAEIADIRERIQALREGAFKRLQAKLEREGHSKESAGAIAYTAGAKKYGKEGMAKKAAEGRRKAANESQLSETPKTFTPEQLKASEEAVERAKEALKKAPHGIQAKSRRKELDQAEAHLTRVRKNLAK